ncbi:MAG: hypothetical protein GX678_05695 [Actinomycetales bacterium]|nr:hypothetical protein [Actinomycetales bacterium]
MEPTNSLQRATDVALGAALTAAPYAKRIVSVAAIPAVLTWRLVRKPPLVPERYALATIAHNLEGRGRAAREQQTAIVLDGSVQLFDALVPILFTATVDRLDIPELVRKAVTKDTVDALISQVDLADVVDQVLTPELIATTLSHIDPVALTEAPLDPVMIEKLIALALPPVLTAALAHLDLTAIVRENVDLMALTNDVVDQLDLAGITNEVIDEIDLPGIIRESTSGVATEVVRGTRASAASADEAIANFFRGRRSE